MHLPRPAVAALLAVVPLAALAGPAAADPGDPPPPTLVDVQLSRTAVSVSGLNGVKVTVSVHLKDPAGVIENQNPEIPAPWPSVTLERTSGGRPTPGAPTFTVRDLDLTSGTAKDGFWTATVLVPSTYRGTWQVTQVIADDADGGTLFVDPRTVGITRSLTVTGSHQPTLSVTLDPKVAVGTKSRMTVKGRVVDADTGAPLRGVQLTLGTASAENCGAFGYGGTGWTSTDAHGDYAFRTAADSGFCVISALPQRRRILDQFNDTTLLLGWASAKIKPVVSGAPARSTVTLGDTTAIRGRVEAVISMEGRRIVLQRLVGRHWREVGSSRIEYEGKYTLYATPPSRGRHHYRALVEKDGDVLEAVSPTMTITAR